METWTATFEGHPLRMTATTEVAHADTPGPQVSKIEVATVFGDGWGNPTGVTTTITDAVGTAASPGPRIYTRH